MRCVVAVSIFFLAGTLHSEENPQRVIAALQIGDLGSCEGRIRISGIVLSGTIGEGDLLEAVGLSTDTGVIDEVFVDGVRRRVSCRRAVTGEECRLFASGFGESFRRGGVMPYYGLVEPGGVTNGTQMRVSLTWASLKDEPLPSGPGFAPAVSPICADTRVEVRFADIKVAAVLRRPIAVRPVGGTDDWNLVLDSPLPIIPRLGFSLSINGRFAAMGTVIGRCSESSERR